MIVLVDDEDRENEGDFVGAAQFLTVEQVVKMSRFASGIITVPMPHSWLERLHVTPMLQENAERMRTAFTVSVDAKTGIATGSSAADRVTTIRRLADPSSRAQDFVRPGHVNPLVVREGRGSRLTPLALELMKQFRRIQSVVEKESDDIYEDLMSDHLA